MNAFSKMLPTLEDYRQLGPAWYARHAGRVICSTQQNIFSPAKEFGVRNFQLIPVILSARTTTVVCEILLTTRSRFSAMKLTQISTFQNWRFHAFQPLGNLPRHAYALLFFHASDIPFFCTWMQRYALVISTLYQYRSYLFAKKCISKLCAHGMLQKLSVFL